MTDPVSSPVCPNCGAQLAGPFCASCGQHQRDLDRPLVELLGEALSSFISFDARLWRTLWILLLRPGKLTLEFLAGRRARYVHPLKLYLATSLGLFLALSLSGGLTVIKATDGENGEPAEDGKPSVVADEPGEPGETERSTGDGKPSPQPRDPRDAGAGEDGGSRLNRLANIVTQAMARDPRAMNRLLTDRLATSIIVLVPVFAALLRLLFWRRRYVAHLIFSFHLHSFAFFLLLVGIAIDALIGTASDGGIGSILANIMIAVYLFLALRQLHRQGRVVTAAKMVALFFGYLFALLITMLCTVAVAVALW